MMAIQTHHMIYSENLPPMTNPDNSPYFFSHFAHTQLENQRMELHYLINSQNELLRQSLRQYTAHQFASILTTYEANAAVLLRQKDEEIAKAKTKNMELQEFLAKLEMENQAWQRMAIYNETVFASLTNTLSCINENNAGLGNSNADVEDAESWCGEERVLGNGICRKCSSGCSSVVFLPCRHLCSCETCEPLMVVCPVCQMVKKSSIQALI